uniref:Uncharacterized protein n=1 Tax=Peronospora matthiolae TaxID=2874970 RepID=A0AAV1TSQ5_9STRA
MAQKSSDGRTLDGKRKQKTMRKKLALLLPKKMLPCCKGPSMI